MPTDLLQRSSLRHWARHPWQAGLSVLGVALGVAVVLSIDLANQSALRSFEISMRTVAGRATHQVVAGPGGLPEETFPRLVLEARAQKAAPVVDGPVRVPKDPGRTLHLLGIDPFSEGPFRPYLEIRRQGLPDLGRFLTGKGACLLTPGTASRLGLAPGERFAVTVGGRTRSLHLVGLLEPRDELGRQALASLLLTDIATAQELLQQVGRLSRIDLVVPEGKQGQALLQRVSAHLPAGAQILTVASRTRTGREMTRAFTLNLTALSLLALFCGIFLIYNSMSFAVVQRRGLFGILRALGTTRTQLLYLILAEGAAVGLVGTILGLALGLLLAGYLLELVTRTMNDLYFVLRVQRLDLGLGSLAKACLLGTGGAVLAALAPALEATGAPPRTVLTRSLLEERYRDRLPRTVVAALLLLAASALLLAPAGPLSLNLAGVFTLLLGAALLTPSLTVGLMRLLRPGARWLFGLQGNMATSGVQASLSRTAIAVAALMIAVAVSVGLGLMIGSFRYTVERWLEVSLRADVYVSAPRDGASVSASVLDRRLVGTVRRMAGVARLNVLRSVTLHTNDGPVQLVALDLDSRSYDAFELKHGVPDEAWPAFQAGDGVLISEPYGYRNALGVGDHVRLPTPRGEHRFPVVGVYYDYGSDRGALMLSLSAYRRLWQDPRISALGVFLAPDVDPEAFMARLRSRFAGEQQLLIRSHRALKKASLQVFDRTFVITDVLRILAGVVAFVGILSALMALQLERGRELGLLRAQGLTPRQVWGLVASQTGLMGLTAGLLSLPLGSALAWIMVYIINRRAFGWTLHLQITAGVLAQALLVAVLAALLAGIYPAHRMSRISPAVAMREE